MHIECEKKRGYTLARVEGSIEVVHGQKLAEAHCLEAGSDDVILDLSAVQFLDSSGVRVLLGIIRGFVGSRRRLILARPSPLVLKTLQLVEFDRLVSITDSVESATGLLLE